MSVILCVYVVVVFQVRYYRVANKMLIRMEKIKSFDVIRKDADATMTTLRTMLKASIKDQKSSSISQLENATLLMELGEAPDTIWPDLLEGRRLKLSAELNRAVKLAEEREAAPPEVPCSSCELCASG
jgi:hypothetical protein